MIQRMLFVFIVTIFRNDFNELKNINKKMFHILENALYSVKGTQDPFCQLISSDLFVQIYL